MNCQILPLKFQLPHNPPQNTSFKDMVGEQRNMNVSLNVERLFWFYKWKNSTQETRKVN